MLVTAWALLLWLMTFVLQWERRSAALACAAATAAFWWPGGWLPGLPVEVIGRSPETVTGELVVGLVLQAVLVTPVALIAIAQYLARWRTDERRVAGGVAVIGAFVAAVSVFAGYLGLSLGITASGAIWLPLIPFIAAEMQRPGRPPERWWGPVIYACVICYGLYFYWLAFQA